MGPDFAPFQMTLGVYSACECRLCGRVSNDGVWMSMGIS